MEFSKLVEALAAENKNAWLIEFIHLAGESAETAVQSILEEASYQSLDEAAQDSLWAYILVRAAGMLQKGHDLELVLQIVRRLGTERMAQIAGKMPAETERYAQEVSEFYRRKNQEPPQEPWKGNA